MAAVLLRRAAVEKRICGRQSAQTAAEGNLIQIIVFAIFFGFILSKQRNLSNQAETLFNCIEAIDDAMNEMVGAVMCVAPFGVCSLIAVMIGTTGLELIKGIGIYIIAYYVALAAIVFIVYPFIIFFLCKLNPIRYFQNVLPVIIMSATTMSSVGTLPVTIRTTRDRCGVPGDIVDLLAPIAATMNMNGAAASQVSYIFFTMNMYGLELSASQIVFTIFLGVIMAIGGSGVPGGGVIMCSVMLSIMGMPQTIVPLIAGIFTILDFGCTVVNVLGDTVGCIWVAKKTGTLDENIFYGSTH